MKVFVSVLCRTFFIVVVLAPIAACLPEGGSLGTGAGGSGGGGGAVSCGGSSGTSALATWANVRDVVDNSCFGSDCHREGEREPILLGFTPLTDAALYTKLTTYKAIKCNDRVLVKPCAPDESSFFRAQAGTCEGLGGIALAQMPFGCLPQYDNCTPADKLEGIRQWIANGAPRP
jgi:hypothetical protein